MSLDSGRWIQPPRLLHNTAILCCASCGAMLPSRYWEAVPDGAPLCRPECKELEQHVDTLADRYEASTAPFPSLLSRATTGARK